MNRFADKVFIVTGAGAGIGLASARLLAENGAKVLITGRREGPLRGAEQDTSGIAALVVDATDPDAAERTVGEAMSRWGRIDGLVNNAGGGVIQPLEAATEAAISDLFKINVGAPTLLASAALPHLADSQGTIVNLSSTFGSKAGAHLGLYGASKAAIEHLTRCWALELAPRNIRVNAIAPGPVETAFLRERMLLSPEQEAAVKQQETEMIPLGRRGVPDDIARSVVHLLDPANDWITGQVIGVDGGLVIR
ncbi:SDR family oxidoreductase [Thalassospira sp.]|uniref:SDR family NAD(P)-dependent oxidoreductase n=1 Tax=Thalassospira sp. TaxID=1912094 RepID=UPI001B0EFEFF|nr:SDR family oxidoreductase [Thalassospira sp.]MBO6807875.1 SDR family oxidoreductase [Thalassospira sp.]MBO6840915.1 SDR family oxidoreductase [Thalassospira sp.]